MPEKQSHPRRQRVIILLSNDLSHPALSKQQYSFSWRINRLRPLLNRGYKIILVAAGGTVGPAGLPTWSSLKPSIKNDGNLVLISPPVLRVPMLWLLHSMIITPLAVLVYCRATNVTVDAIVAASVPYGAIGKLLNRFTKTRLVVDYGDPDYARERSISLKILHLLEGYVLRRGGVDIVTCIDPNICTYVGRYGVKDPLFLPPGGFWKNEAKPAGNVSTGGREQVIIYAGHLAPPPVYRLDLLVEAAPRIFAQNPDAKIVVVGSGEYEPVMRKRVRELQVADRFEFVGQLPFADTKARIAMAEVAVQVLNDMCLGTKVLDYFALGKAVVSCGNFFDSYSEFLANGVNCILVPPDKDRLAEGINLVLSRPDLRKTLGQNALETVSKFDWDSQADRLLESINGAPTRAKPKEGKANY